MTVLVAVLVALAVAVVVPPGHGGPRPTRSRTTRRGPGLPWGRRAGDHRDARAVLEVCDVLAAELTAGRATGPALATAATHWTPLAPVVEAHLLGADVPAALRELAVGRSGARDLRLVAAAWQVSHQTGHGLAHALARTSQGIRARHRTRHVVESELASARATARLVAALPVVALVMGSGVGGGSPWAFLLATPVGLGCLLGGSVLMLGGLVWIERIADRATPP